MRAAPPHDPRRGAPSERAGTTGSLTGHDTRPRRGAAEPGRGPNAARPRQSAQPGRRPKAAEAGGGPDAAECGQAAVELALVLPLLAILLLALVQVGVVVREQILVVHAAREAAREAAVDPSADAARAAASESSSLDSGRLDVSISGRGGPGSRVRVTARYGPPTAVPLVGEVVKGLRLEASATMRVER